MRKDATIDTKVSVVGTPLAEEWGSMKIVDVYKHCTGTVQPPQREDPEGRVREIFNTKYGEAFGMPHRCSY